VENAIQVISHGKVNWQTKRHQEAVKFLQQTVAGKKTGDPEIHLALAYHEMGKFGSRTDKNFDAAYVLKHLGFCKAGKRPFSVEVYRAFTNAYRRLELNTCRTYKSWLKITHRRFGRCMLRTSRSIEAVKIRLWFSKNVAGSKN